MTTRNPSPSAEARRRSDLASAADEAARKLRELCSKAHVHGELLPWGVEETARALEDWARRYRYTRRA